MSSIYDQTEDSVWDVYNLLRTTRLNVLYWTARQHQLERTNLILDVLLATTVASAFLSGMLFELRYEWGILSFVALLIAVAKPFLRIPARVASYQAAVARYTVVQGMLQELQLEIARKKVYDEQMRQYFSEIVQVLRRALENEPYEPIKVKLRLELTDRVNTEMPANMFYVPGKGSPALGPESTQPG